MSRFLSVLCIFCLACSPVFAQDKKTISVFDACMDKAMSTIDMSICYKIKIDALQKSVDSNLNRIYQSKKISAQYKTQTREVQKHWLNYAKLYASSVCPSINLQDCGTISQLTSAQRLITKLEQREKEIRIQLKDIN